MKTNVYNFKIRTVTKGSLHNRFCNNLFTMSWTFSVTFSPVKHHGVYGLASCEAVEREI